MRKVLVACRSAEGRHNGANIAGHIDKIVGAVPGLKGSTTWFCVTKNAANMLYAVPRMTKKIDKGLGCFDHLVNLVMKDTNKADPTIADAIKVIFVIFVMFVLLYCKFCYFQTNIESILTGLENEERYNILHLNEDGVEFATKVSSMIGKNNLF